MSRTQANIRQACYSDHAAIRDFVGGLSLRARYLRFFTGAVATSPVVLRILAGGGDHIDAIVAVENGTIIGHAMASDATGPGSTVTENRQVLAMIADHWPTAKHDLSGAYATIQVPLPQPAGGQVPLAAKEQPPPHREE